MSGMESGEWNLILLNGKTGSKSQIHTHYWGVYIFLPASPNSTALKAEFSLTQKRRRPREQNSMEPRGRENDTPGASSLEALPKPVHGRPRELQRSVLVNSARRLLTVVVERRPWVGAIAYRHSLDTPDNPGSAPRSCLSIFLRAWMLWW